jgi:predicted transcriptional regulator YdeE
MQQASTQLTEMKLVGITVRTNNQNESDWSKGKIFPCVQQYFHQQLSEKISNRQNPSTTLCAYTDYESDHTGDYTYFIGEEVSAFDTIPEGLTTLTIPPQQYAKFTTEPGAMPTVLGDAWQAIWKMTPQTFGAARRYHTDFEVYDDRAKDHENIVLDIYIGLQD